MFRNIKNNNQSPKKDLESGCKKKKHTKDKLTFSKGDTTKNSLEHACPRTNQAALSSLDVKSSKHLDKNTPSPSQKKNQLNHNHGFTINNTISHHPKIKAASAPTEHVTSQKKQGVTIKEQQAKPLSWPPQTALLPSSTPIPRTYLIPQAVCQNNIAFTPEDYKNYAGGSLLCKPESTSPAALTRWISMSKPAVAAAVSSTEPFKHALNSMIKYPPAPQFNKSLSKCGSTNTKFFPVYPSQSVLRNDCQSVYRKHHNGQTTSIPTPTTPIDTVPVVGMKPSSPMHSIINCLDAVPYYPSPSCYANNITYNKAFSANDKFRNCPPQVILTQHQQPIPSYVPQSNSSMPFIGQIFPFIPQHPLNTLGRPTFPHNVAPLLQTMFIEDPLGFTLEMLPIPCAFLRLPWPLNKNYCRLVPKVKSLSSSVPSSSSPQHNEIKQQLQPHELIVKRMFVERVATAPSAYLIRYVNSPKVWLLSSPLLHNEDSDAFCDTSSNLSISSLLDNDDIAETLINRSQASFPASHIVGLGFTTESTSISHIRSSEAIRHNSLHNDVCVVYFRLKLSDLPFKRSQLEEDWNQRRHLIDLNITTLVIVFDYRFSDISGATTAASLVASSKQQQQSHELLVSSSSSSSSWSPLSMRCLIHLTAQTQSILNSWVVNNLEGREINIIHLPPPSFSEVIDHAIHKVINQPQFNSNSLNDQKVKNNDDIAINSMISFKPPDASEAALQYHKDHSSDLQSAKYPFFNQDPIIQTQPTTAGHQRNCTGFCFEKTDDDIDSNQQQENRLKITDNTNKFALIESKTLASPTLKKKKKKKKKTISCL